MVGKTGRLLGVLVLTWCLSGFAAESQNPQLTVFVVERAGVSPHLLLEAEADAAHIIGRAGLDVNWITCRDGAQAASCGAFSQADLIVHLIPRGRASGDVFGVAFVENDVGTYADLFFDPIQRLREQARTLSLSPVLGGVLAHEIGHLLLGSNAHSRVGIMQPHWEEEQLHNIDKGRMVFTREQAAKLRARVSLMHGNNQRECLMAGMSAPQN